MGLLKRLDSQRFTDASSAEVAAALDLVTTLLQGAMSASDKIKLDSIVTAALVTLTGLQTLTNKTLTGPVLTGPALGTPISGNLANCNGLQVSGGGTGLSALTAHSLQVGNGSSAPTQLGVGSTGTLLAGVSSGDPAFSATPTLGVQGTTAGKLTVAAGNGGAQASIVLNGASSGAVTLHAPVSAGTTDVTLPSATGTLSTLAGIETLTNKALTSPALTTPTLSTATPASASAAGVAGTIVWDSSFIYICVATNTWKRVAIATW